MLNRIIDKAKHTHLPLHLHTKHHHGSLDDQRRVSKNEEYSPVYHIQDPPDVPKETTDQQPEHRPIPPRQDHSDTLPPLEQDTHSQTETDSDKEEEQVHKPNLDESDKDCLAPVYPTPPSPSLEEHQGPLLHPNEKTSGTPRHELKSLKYIDFNVIKTLGTGSFGRVHLVQSKFNERFYALKVLKKSEIVRLKQVEHTRNERAVLLTISHPFIVNLWGTFQDSTYLYMVMDYVPGGELFSYLRKQKTFPDDVAKFYSAQVLLALVYMHSKNIVYRDLKPENILLDAQGNIKITDFGFAKILKDDRTWTLCGTPDYLAPEVIQSKGYGKSVDYWSLGVLIYEMLAGHPPFYDESQFRLYEKILTKEPKFPDTFSDDAKDLLKHLLTTNLTKRYGNLKGGYHDVMNHPWFASIDFQLLGERKLKPPFVPTVKSNGDSSNFDHYDENHPRYGVDGKDQYPGLFKEF
ncbi:camp-dependent protein kinase 6 [Phycomyces nitens]|nr:camp-dependent protein kinase 6 [Phycomyces nitens]